MDAVETFAGLHRHGGRLAEARRLFPHAPTPWIDLSTGVNPVPWTGEGVADDGKLPDPEATAALEYAAAGMFGVAADHVAAVPGTELALRLLPVITGARRVGIVSPTYSSHEQAWSASAVRRVARGDMDIGGLDALVIGNPNNPDGAVISRNEVLVLAERMERRNGWLIVDEAFADATPELSVADKAFGRLIVLRSFGKFFGRPGVRLGFVVAGCGVLVRLKGLVGEWPVSTLATVVGAAAYADRSWHQATRARLGEDAKLLDQELTKAGFTVIGGTSLFRLATHERAEDRFHKLAAQGVLTRPFAAQPSWLRFGLPKPEARARVYAALRDCA
ncbi:MAG: threonine-phosphate decarboxylase CobD [Rhodospirillaceae bacterium]|nr:threonine-phosphate decarboxylase CobD [Rhodospirillaceae bacterium]